MVESIRELRRICQGSSTSSDKASAIFYRRFSIYFTKVFLYTKITANQITLLNILTGILGSALLAFGHYYYSIVGALLLQIWYTLDHTDGEVARYRKQESIVGVYLDHMNHNLVSSAIFAGLSFGVYNNYHDVRIFIFGFLSALFCLMPDLSSYVRGQFVQDQKVETRSALRRSKLFDLAARLYFHKISYVFKIYTILALILLGSALDHLCSIVVVYGVLLPCLWIFQVSYYVKGKLMVDDIYQLDERARYSDMEERKQSSQADT